MCLCHPQFLPCSKCLGLIASPCSLPYLSVGVHIVVSPCGWITRPPGIPRAGMVYCPTTRGMVNCRTTESGRTGTSYCTASCSSGIVNYPTGSISNCGGGRGRTLSCSKVASGVSLIDLFYILAIATTILRRCDPTVGACTRRAFPIAPSRCKPSAQLPLTHCHDPHKQWSAKTKQHCLQNRQASCEEKQQSATCATRQ